MGPGVMLAGAFGGTTVDDTVLRGLALVIALGGAAELLRRFIRWCWRLGKSWDRIDVATRQLVANGGESVKDKVNTIAARQHTDHQLMLEVQQDVRELSRRADVLERRLHTLNETQVVDGQRLDHLEHKESA
jgi:uncharacterized membrane protein